MSAKPVLFRVNNNLNIGGITSRMRLLLPLLKNDFDVHVVTYRSEGILAPELRDQGIAVHHVPLPGKWNPGGLRALAGLFRREKADIVHTHSFGGNISGILAAALAGVPVRLGQVHVRGQHWYARNALHRRKQMLEEYLVHSLFSNAVLFPSGTALEYFKAHCPVSRKKLMVLHNGIELPARDKTPVNLRRELGIPDNIRILGFAGRITASKGLEFILSFMQAVQRANAPYCLVMAGDPDKEEGREFQARAEALGPALIRFLGLRRDMAALYQAFDALFFPSEPWAEALPGVVLEAAAHGLPILARNNETVREIAESYSGIYCMRDTENPLSALDALFALPPADPSRIRETFSIGAMAAATKALYEKFLSGAYLRK